MKMRLRAMLSNREWLVTLAFVAAAVLTWEGLARAGRVSAVLFPAPSRIALTIARLAGSGDLFVHAGATLRRLAVGFFLGAAPALGLGLAMGASRSLRRAVDPLVAATHPIPKIAILPLVMILFGIGELSKVTLVALGAFFPILINTMAGVRQISPIHFEVAQNYGAGPGKVFTRVLFPGSLPMILTGVRLGANIALLLTIAVEMTLAEKGFGGMVWLAWETLRTEEMYASLVLIALLGIGFSASLEALSRRWVPWRVEREV